MRRYGPNQRTEAYKAFAASLNQVRYILRIEAKIPDPPTGRNTNKANALRASALILNVSIFEYFLKAAFTEVADRINAISERERRRLDQGLLDRNGFAFAEFIRNYKGSKSDRLAHIRQAAVRISADGLFAEAFGDTRASPKPQTVREMFDALGTANVWPQLASKYNSLGPPDAESAIVDRLQFLCETRNEVVHAGGGVRVSRLELQNYVMFTERLASAVDSLLRDEFHRFT